jgi:5'-nucleotidase / UDP-sugar diphosphatase
MTEKRFIAATLLAGVLAGCPAEDTQPTRRVRFLFTTDEHSQLLGSAPELDDRDPALGTGRIVGGVLRRATILAENRADGVDTVTVSAGDWSQGALASAAFAVANFDLSLMKVMGYDAVGLGNHEFDIGPQGLAMAVTAAQARGKLPPLVLTNVRFSAASAADDALAALHGPRGSGRAITASRVVTTAGGVRVGVVAALGPGAAYDCSPTAAPLTFTEGYLPSPANHGAALAAVAATVQAEIDSLRAEEVDAVLLLGHGGVGHTADQRGDDEQLVRLLHGVDLVVSGHTHEQPDAVRWITAFDGRQVPVMQPAAYGRQVGRAELVLSPGQAPALDADPARTRFFQVDDRVAASTDATLRTELGTMIGALETRTGASPSFLEATLSAVEGAAVVDDPAVVGDLYFRPLGHTAFDVVGLAAGETNALNLDTDAMLAAANLFSGPTTAALQATGAIRGDLLAGQTGQLAFADVYRMVPLGLDPADGTPGYPLVRFHLLAAELRGAIELTLGLALSNGDYFVSPSGLAVEYDLTRPPLDAGNPLSAGWITWLARVGPDGTEVPLYDAGAGGWQVAWNTPIPVVSTYQVGAFAVSMGVLPRTETGAFTTLAASVVRRPGGSAVKDHQALGAYLKAACAANGGELPARYDATTTEGQVPRRMRCTGPACP